MRADICDCFMVCYDRRWWTEPVQVTARNWHPERLSERSVNVQMCPPECLVLGQYVVGLQEIAFILMNILLVEENS